MGLPELNISYQTLARTVVQRSARGIVACILRDGTQGGAQLATYNTLDNVDYEHYTEDNYEALKLIFAGAPNKVIVARVPEDAADYAAALDVLRNLRWNYLTIPGIEAAQTTLVSNWIQEQREQHRKTCKAVLPNAAADYEGIINYTTGNVQTTLCGTVCNAAKYCARIAGVLAGVPLTQSCTYMQLPDIVSADTPTDPDARIDKGELVLVYDGEAYKIGRGVNSYVSLKPGKGADMTKIKIVEARDLYQDDLLKVYQDQYLGRVNNTYDNKQALVAAIAAYHKEVVGTLLDAEYAHSVGIDIDAQRKYLEAAGTDTTDMDDTAIARANTGSKVFLASNVKFLDAMEDLDYACNM